MKTKEDLRRLLLSIDHKGYPAYKETKGKWSWGNYVLSIDHVQGDPFATPSGVSVIVPGKTADFPEAYVKEDHRRIALQDHLLRLLGEKLVQRERSYAGSGKSGLVTTSRPGQEVLERTACRIEPADGQVTLRFQVGFPANGRTINARELLRILEEQLPETVEKTLMRQNLNQKALEGVIDLADDRKYIRSQLEERGLCAFIADGSILPRKSGVSSLPMQNAVPFKSPESMAVIMELPHHGSLRGMGIRKGITLIVGGGYHGKSTLLQALEMGVYDHIKGDGREYVITDPQAVKIRAEDGRSIVGTDISVFIQDLPNGKDTVRFTTEDASGSTSQAANVVEAMEAGCSLLLIDEDTSATNFMVRDSLMASVVSPDKEPITPFVSRIRDLYETSGVSTILVAGSSGAFFHEADTVILMDRYIPCDITGKAKAAAALEGDGLRKTIPEGRKYHGISQNRIPEADRALLREQRIKLKTLSDDSFLIAHNEVDLRGLEQIADREQTAALAYMLKYMQLHLLDGKTSLPQAARKMLALANRQGLEILFEGSAPGNGLAQVRLAELCGMLNRFRNLRIK